MGRTGKTGEGSFRTGRAIRRDMTPSRRTLVVTLAVFALAVASRALVFAIPGYRAMYGALPEILQWLEQPVRWTLLCLLGLWLGGGIRPRTALRELGLAGSPLPGLGFGLLATLPMLAGPAVLGRFQPDDTALGLLFSAAVWPLGEEILYRGFAFGQLHRRAGVGLWPAAIGTGVVFGAVHLAQASVRRLPLSGEIGVVALIGVGGLLYAWLYARWGFNLWVPLALHGLMNLWWGLFSVADNPLGGWFPNALRVLTVVLAVLLTLYRERIPFLRSRDGSGRTG